MVLRRTFAEVPEGVHVDERVEIHLRIVARVRALMDEHELSTRDVGDLLGLDRSGVMRRMIVEQERVGAPGRWRLVEWRAWELSVLSSEYEIPLQEFFTGQT